jgi:hypothetical protein
MTAPDPSPSPDRARTHHRMRALFTDDLGLKAIALLLSLLLWLAVGARTPTEGYLTVRIEPELDSSLALLGDAPHVRALVAGRTADLVKLYAARPVVRRTISGDAPDTLVLDVTPSDVHVPPELADAVHVLDVQPRSVTLRFASRATRRVDVVNQGRIVVQGSGGAGGAVAFEPATVRVTGPRAAVRRVRSLQPRPLVIAPGDTLQHVAELDTAGLGIRANPVQVRVRVLPEGGR